MSNFLTSLRISFALLDIQEDMFLMNVKIAKIRKRSRQIFRYLIYITKRRMNIGSNLKMAQ